MLRFRVGLAVVAITMTALAVPGAFTAGGGVANAVPIPGGDITVACAGTTNGTTFTLTADCGEVTTSLTVPAAITTVDGGGHTISATDLPALPGSTNQFNGGIVTNAAPGQTMNIQNVTITGPAAGFQLCVHSGNVLYGIFFNGAGGGSVTNVTVDHIFQFQNFAFGSCQTGRAIRADDSGTVTITNTVVEDYQKSGFEARGSTIMNVSGSTAGPPHPLNGFSSQNAVSIVGASATIANNTIHGSGNQGPGLGRGNGTGVLVQSGAPVTVDHNIITGAGTNIGVSVSANSTNVTISFNQIGRTSADAPPDDPGIGVDVDHPTSSATLICNTFSGWITNIVGAVQISCTPLPNGTECITYSADTLSVEGGTAPFTWSVSGGTLPPGLTLAPSTGAITGTPTAAGTFNFTATVVDSTEPTLTAAQAQTITIAPGCAPPPTTTTPPTPPTPPSNPAPPPQRPMLVIRKVANKHTVRGNNTIQFTITLRARGQGTARNVQVCDVLPPGLMFVRAPGATFRGGRACWRITSISAGRSRSYHVTVRGNSVQRATFRTNVATVVSPRTNCTAPRVRRRDINRAKVGASLARCRATARVLVRPLAGGRPGGVTG